MVRKTTHFGIECVRLQQKNPLICRKTYKIIKNKMGNDKNMMSQNFVVVMGL
jgi:hypothetical protein